MVEVDSMDIVAKLSVPIWEDRELEIPAIFAPSVGQMMYCVEIPLALEPLELLEDEEDEVMKDDEDGVEALAELGPLVV